MAISYSAIIAAGGSALRYGTNKLREKVGGKAVLSHSLDLFDADEDCGEVIVALGADTRAWVEGNPLIFASPKLKLVNGGDSRAQSVANALREARGRYLAIHDAARPNVKEELLARLKASVSEGRGAVPGIALTDTVAYVEGAGGDAPADDFFAAKASRPLLQITSHPKREGLYSIQTPQFFDRASYEAALNQLSGDTGGLGLELSNFNDDSSLYCAAGFSVVVVEGSPGNVKITTPADLQLLHKLMGTSEKKSKDKYGGLGW
jgi:2-C-methyl-D-erythritol 4-phosphate cytidylyltransferase